MEKNEESGGNPDWTSVAMEPAPSGTSGETGAPKKNLFGKARDFVSEKDGNFDALLSYAARTPPMAVVLDAFFCGIAVLLLYLLLRA